MGSFKKVKSGFTLAETLIVVAILGVIAVITIPNLIKNQIEAQNRTKVKKAMSVYERALSKMAIENELKTDNMINTWANEEANCGNTFKYFKASQGQGCMFKTSDGVWWDITNILRPMIYLKREGINSNNKETVTGYAKDPDNKEAFILVGRFEDAISALRINDKAFEDSHTVTNNDDFDGTSTKAKLEKLYGFMNKVKTCDVYCKIEKYKDTRCTTQPYKECVYISNTITNSYANYYDENGNLIMQSGGCTKGTSKNCEWSDVREFFPDGKTSTLYYDCDGDGKNCLSEAKYEYKDNIMIERGRELEDTWVAKYEYRDSSLNVLTTYYDGCNENAVKCTGCHVLNSPGNCKKNSHGFYDPEDTVYD